MPKLENKRFNFLKLLQIYLAASMSLRIYSPKNSLNWRVNVINTSLFSSPKRVNTLFSSMFKRAIIGSANALPFSVN